MPAKTTSKNAKVVKNKVSKNKKVEVKETTTPVTPPVTETPVQAEMPVETTTPYLEEFTAVVSELDNALNLVRNLKARLQKLEKQVHRDHKVMAKKMKGRTRKPRDPNAPKSGFAKEGPVSDEMRKFLGMKKDGLISRTDVTKKIHEYCKAKNLREPCSLFATKRQGTEATARRQLGALPHRRPAIWATVRLRCPRNP